METQRTRAEIENLTRQELRNQQARLSEIDRDLTARLVLAYKSQGPAAPLHVTENAERVHARAQHHLNGHAGLLAPLPSGASEAQLFAEREAVRLASRTLQRAELELGAVEAQLRAQKFEPEWRAMVREWTLLTTRWIALNERAWKIHEADVEAFQALPFSLLLRAHIDFDAQLAVDEFIAQVVAAGVVSKADVERAKRGKGDA